MSDEDLVAVRLHPFAHQVGGHCTMLKLDEMTVCKPLVLREHMFYKSLPEDLAEFVPQYKGSVSVEFTKEATGYIMITGYLPQSELQQIATVLPNGTARNLIRDLNEAEYAKGTNVSLASQCAAKCAQPKDVTRDVYRIRVESKTGQFVIDDDAIDEYDNPQEKLSTGLYFSKCIANLMAADRQRHKFILLGNLVAHYKRPCILDLKMGTRQHGDTDNEEKMRNKQGRCQLTTSAQLGLRICGMQVYNLETSKYVNRDKYFGRMLTADGVRDTLRLFLCNGRECRYDAVMQFVDKLKRFHAVVQKQDTFRFYSTSLLLIYDGADQLECGAAARNGAVHIEKTAASSGMQLPDTVHSSKAETTATRLPRVDMRAIDFAHVTFKGFGADELVHVGPDAGYLLGLQNLIKLLQEIGNIRTEQ